MAVNASLVPSPNDLLMVFPRLARFAMQQLPELIKGGGSVIAEATAANMTTATVTSSASAMFAQNTAAAIAAAAAEAADDGMFSWLMSAFNFDGVRGLGGMFSYFSSRWALATFTVSICLNRTHFYASSRQNLDMRWRTRLLLYSIPIVLLLTETLWVLQAMRCQTSPKYPLMRFGDPLKRKSINFGGDGGFMYNLSSTLLFWQDDNASCAAMDMALPPDGNKLNVMGSFNLVWQFFITLCVSQFVETLSCALQGRQPMPETGMTTFEHSLAFAECEAMISNALGLGIFGSTAPERSGPGPKVNTTSPFEGKKEEGNKMVVLSRAMILKRLNVPSEVLLISFISCLSHLSSSVLAVTGLRQRFRLVNTGIWALCYMSAFIWSFVKIMDSDSDDALGILKFPTVCIIGFIPHLLILTGIFVCGSIYGIALLVTAISLPRDAPPNPSLKERFHIAFQNLQANVQFSSSSSIKLNWQEDFYTCLLKVGFNILTAASDAVYLNEGSRIQIGEMTWLEEKRIQELSAAADDRSKTVPAALCGEQIAYGIGFTDSNVQDSRSGYARERKSRATKDTDMARTIGIDSGLGLAERRNRWQLMLEFFKGITSLFLRIFARVALRSLEKLHIEQRPRWLVRYAGLSRDAKSDTQVRRQLPLDRDFWLIGNDGSLALPDDGNVDVENETRRRLQAFNTTVSDEVIDSNLYNWWKTGGWWGEVDSSGDFQARDEDDDDLTSMVSMSAATSNAGSDAGSSGRRTPTQEDPFPAREEESMVRDTSVERTLGFSDLARLLDPKSSADREEARILSRHLQAERPMTRSQYQRMINSDKSRILPLKRLHGQAGNSADTLLSDLDEEQALEEFILERRARAVGKATNAGSGSWDSGASGMGAGGPQCVVCQSSPRVILVWPCGCLSICDECRVGVAARNFANCLCCRTGVVAYSRLFVP